MAIDLSTISKESSWLVAVRCVRRLLPILKNSSRWSQTLDKLTNFCILRTESMATGRKLPDWPSSLDPLGQLDELGEYDNNSSAIFWAGKLVQKLSEQDDDYLDVDYIIASGRKALKYCLRSLDREDFFPISYIEEVWNANVEADIAWLQSHPNTTPGSLWLPESDFSSYLVV